MKRIEAVITPWSLDAFKEAAPRLGISEFDLVEVYRSGCETTDGQRVYRGRQFAAALLPRLRVEFVLFDDNVQATLHELLELVHPESVAIFKLDQTASPTRSDCAIVTRLRKDGTSSAAAPSNDVFGLVQYNGAKGS